MIHNICNLLNTQESSGPKLYEICEDMGQSTMVNKIVLHFRSGASCSVV